MPEKGTVNRYGETWDGTQWQSPGRATSGGGKGGGPGIVPPTNRAAPPPSSGGWNRNDLLKEILTTGGMVAGGMLAPEIEGPALIARLLRVGGAAAGGATGRMAGHVPEAVVNAQAGRPSDTTFLDEAKRGAVEGAVGEALPAVAGPVLRGVGRVGRWGGRVLGDTSSMLPWQRTAAAVGRGITARELGLPAAIQGAAAGGPIAATEIGRGAEALGSKIGSGTTSERLQAGLAALRRRLNPPIAPTHAEGLAAGESRFMAARRAEAAQQAAREGASDLSPDLGERVPVRSTEPVPQAEPGDFPRWTPRESSPLEDLLKQRSNTVPPPPPAEPSVVDTLRQRTGTAYHPVEPMRSAPPFTFEGASTGMPGEFPTAPAAPGFNVGEVTGAPVRKPPPVAPWEVETTPFAHEGAANVRPGEFAPGQAAPGFEISPALGLDQVPASRATQTLTARTRGAGGRYARTAAKKPSRTLTDDLKASLRARGVEPE